MSYSRKLIEDGRQANIFGKYLAQVLQFQPRLPESPVTTAHVMAVNDGFGVVLTQERLAEMEQLALGFVPRLRLALGQDHRRLWRLVDPAVALFEGWRKQVPQYAEVHPFTPGLVEAVENAGWAAGARVRAACETISSISRRKLPLMTIQVAQAVATSRQFIPEASVMAYRYLAGLRSIHHLGIFAGLALFVAVSA